MAFKLTKSEQAQRDDVRAKVETAFDALSSAVDEYNEGLEALNEALTKARDDYCEALEEARGFAADIVSQAEEDFGEKSERWQEGERGEAVREWITEWEHGISEDPDFDLPGPIAVQFASGADELDNLPDEPSF